MKSRSPLSLGSMLIALNVILALFCFLALGKSLSAAPLDTAPTITAVDPSAAYNNLDITITITGTNFAPSPAPTVYLGATPLPNVTWVNSTELTATLPWGLNPGVYTLTVTNSDGQSGSMANAFTVQPGIGVWTSDGPYGGSIEDVAVSPVTSQTVFAAVRGAGLYWSQDGGDHWSMRFGDANVSRPGVMFGPPPTHALYYWGASGLWRSTDGGESFDRLFSEDVAGFAIDPQNSQRLWVSAQGLEFSTDGGTTWQVKINGLPANPCLCHIALDPVTPSTLYVTINSGRVFKTVNDGDDWTAIDSDLPDVGTGHEPMTLAVDPTHPHTVLIGRRFDPAPGYRSTDGGATWSPVTVESNDAEALTDIAFSPVTPTVVYASWLGMHLMGLSTDGGATWTPLGDWRAGDWMYSLGLDPTTGVPVYLGGASSGMWRSRSGGQNWQLATQGIGALPIDGIAAAPGHPGTVYVAADAAGGFMSQDAGQSWRQADLSNAMAASVAVDPQQSGIAYFGSRNSVYRTLDGGALWEPRSIPGIVNNHIETLALAPSTPAVVYAGGRDNDALERTENLGVAYQSLDYGATWTQIDFGQPISNVAAIAIHPLDGQVVYVATGRRADVNASDSGLGIFRSTDGGATWQPSQQGMGHVQVVALAIRPDQPQTIYALGWLPSAQKLTVYKSTNGGDQWAPTSLRLDWWWRGGSLVIDPLVPDTLYVGTERGLYRSTDGGLTWTQASGTLGSTTIQALSAASDGQRTILYVGVIGGMPVGSSAGFSSQVSIRASNFIEGGVYQLTLDHRSITVENDDVGFKYNGWRSVSDSPASGSTYRVSKVANDKATFKFKGTSVQWITRKGPDMGKAQVLIDNVLKDTFDLYSSTGQSSVTLTFNKLANRKHTLVIKVLGTKNIKSKGKNVAVDAFIAGASTTEDDSPAVQYNTWSGYFDANASGGSYRASITKGAVASLMFSGTSIDWITAKGAAYGKAEVWIDKVRKETVDLYSPTQQWQVKKSYGNLSAGSHTIQIKVLGTKRTVSKGTTVVVDAFSTPIMVPGTSAQVDAEMQEYSVEDAAP